MGDPSHEMDLVPVFRSQSVSAGLEAMAVQAMLEAAGIPAVLVGTSSIPSLPFQVMVPRARIEEAERAVAEAREAGPLAA
ncbi:MAG: putative signal transducing protein, partial [Bryobacteraceae bacterium]